MLADGKTVAAIADSFDRGSSRAYARLKGIMDVLEVHTYAGIVAVALRNGWIK